MIECYGMEDEENCQNYTCLPGFLKCQNNVECIRVENFCDTYEVRHEKTDLNMLKVFVLVIPYGHPSFFWYDTKFLEFESFDFKDHIL